MRPWPLLEKGTFPGPGGGRRRSAPCRSRTDPVLRGLLETQFKEIEADSGPKGIKKRIERSPIIDEKDLRVSVLNRDAAGGTAAPGPA
jgi:hypothetical protein